MTFLLLSASTNVLSGMHRLQDAFLNNNGGVFAFPARSIVAGQIMSLFLKRQNSKAPSVYVALFLTTAKLFKLVSLQVREAHKGSFF
jgi:hypothetical protein